jgi:ABC-type phosphate transport system permease subunit
MMDKNTQQDHIVKLIIGVVVLLLVGIPLILMGLQFGAYIIECIIFESFDSGCY